MKLDLYMFETCPYCQKVFREIERTGRTDVVMHDVKKNQEDMDTLIKVGGEYQVPCLFIDGKPMYESDDIVAWLAANPQQA
ncbi:MAG: glutathione S-transferase N-terminal domain-containing protein [Firmicutes bacterium]|nr:glutathione S-transferase N-terminal domain-containing protein [Bacillota bacterium]MBQ1887442.1 glutathione S-transferase N-terminal domain-containing protein [Bacillota bacterium]MBQ2455888.1 glutathione S-transferase N-terminal domain-containing protein [Bacillota bacterium]MBQ3577452.1 glutathione S-transferase N-terminal domain-containing protein [Bacillota bacterium]MBQ4181778.1 glutathione S-transferase N-terminal domain-containing protein [Bacillota bacterium]